MNEDIAPVEAIEEVDERAICVACDKPIEEADEQSRGNFTYCQDCYTIEFERECYRCGNSMDVEDSWEYDSDDYCRDCYDNLDNDEDEGSFAGREYSDKNLPTFQSVKSGEFITSQRMFSAELEAYYPDISTMREVVKALPLEVGICTDGSLHEKGVEMQTPKLRGARGEEAIKTICKILNNSDFTTNASTGLHIHLDGKGLLPKRRTKDYPKAVIELFRFYMASEEVILSFLPPSRRVNRFCKVLRSEFHAKEIADVRNLEELEKIWYRVEKRFKLKREKSEKYNSTRYAGINFHSLFKDGHLEVRYHSGTLNATKILEWTVLHQAILDGACVPYRGIGGRAERMHNMPNLAEKTEMFFSILSLPERSRKYWTERQVLFTSTAKDNSEQVNEPVMCAE